MNPGNATPLHRSPADRGVVLVWFALFVFVLLGILSLVVDVGMARLVQRQMQAAVDAAAVEGLRPTLSAQDPTPRERVQALVAWSFDDDFDLNEDAMGFAAGPIIDLSGGTGSLNALQTIEGARPYDPLLEFNTDNLIHGDMVSGRFAPLASSLELSDYQRADFAASAPETSGPAFLVRMRRGHDPLGLDNEAGVNSSGPGLPLLFGRGTTISGGDPSSGYSPRHHGLTVRATAIADVEDRGAGRTRIKSAGPSLAATTAGGPLTGRTPWSIDDAAWEALPIGVARTVEISADGTLRDAGVEIGRFVTDAETLAAVVTAIPALAGAESGYVPILATIAGNSRVIGYGRGSLVPLSNAGVDLRALTRLPPVVATENASAVITARVGRQLALLHQQSPAAFATLMSLHRSFGGAVTAPVLVR